MDKFCDLLFDEKSSCNLPRITECGAKDKERGNTTGDGKCVPCDAAVSERTIHREILTYPEQCITQFSRLEGHKESTGCY